MITKVTKENNDLYRALFQKASEQLWADPDTDPETEITSIDDYFTCLETLTAADPVFKVLPLDEPTLDIDTNTRVITVPNAFKNNGVAVKGDQIAEILYFTVDRYFENVDLAHDDTKIIIQWETAASNGAAEKGISKAFIKDVTIFKEDGKLLFGWALNSSITENPGTIKFAVRFYRTNAQNQIIFNLSTLTANAIINPGLDYQYNSDEGAFEFDIIDDSELIDSRIRDSEPASGSDSAPAPVFSQNLNIGENKGTAANPYYVVDLDNSGQYVLKALADAENCKITYEWHRTPLNSVVDTVLSGDSDGYRITEDETYQADKAYFVKQPIQGIMRYVAHTGTTGEEIPAALTVYEYGTSRTIQLTANNQVTGNYYVKAKSRHGLASNSTNSYTVRIPGPGALEAHEATSATPNLDNVYEKFLDSVENKATLSVTGSTLSAGDAINYKWEHKVGNAYELVDNTTNSLVAAPATGTNVRVYDEMYKATVTASRNGDATTPQTFEFRVTHEAEAPTLTASADTDATASAPATISVTANVSNILSDSLTYQWCKYTSVADDNEEIEGATSANYDALPGKYYCKVTNHVNGHTAVTTSSMITVADVG